MSLCYSSPLGPIRLEDSVLDVFERYRQCPGQPEAGGQLFFRPSLGDIVVTNASEPSSSDRRGPAFFQPDATTEQTVINEKFGEGLHFIGDWHTHAELLPRPSWDDRRRISRIFRKSEHELRGMFLMVVGRAGFPDGLWCGVIMGAGRRVIRLHIS